MGDPSLVRFRRAVESACAALESRRQEVNDLNVFPVADGDTGDNMAMTLRAVLAELDRMGEQDIDEIGRDELVAAVARAALLGARGNSGVILSQIVRGAAEELASRPGELIDPILVSAALARAADAAYDSVRNPAEGTMLSAVRAMAHRVARDVAHMQPQRLGPGVDTEEQDKLLAEVLERALDAGAEAVERGPEQLEVLREAGVVDAGAYGLTVIIAGVIAALRDDDALPELEHHTAPVGGLHQHTGHESSRYRYCTNFAVTGDGLEPSPFVPLLEGLGDSVLVVGDPHTLKVHVHTDDPEAAMALFRDAGEVSRLDVADMREQIAEREERLAAGEEALAACGVLAVVNGPGIRSLYEGLGAHVVEGGPTMNPSTNDLLAGIHAAPAREIVLLPNNPNVIMAAQKAAELSEKPVCVVPTRSQQAGIPALLELDPDGSADGNAKVLNAAVARLRTGGVAPAARDDAQGRFVAGEALAYVGDDLVDWGDPERALSAVIARIADGSEVLTCLAGVDAPLSRATVARAVPEGMELDHHVGGQPAWWWLLCAE
jgi:DAK2 domain fusion protein YloV